jgi:DNA-directed RNA polymerase specialized sigma subunit
MMLFFLATGKKDDGMERFLKQVEPIIKAQAKRFKPYIKGWEFEDLMQEGRLSALLALTKWKNAGKTRKAGIFSWTKIYVVSRFKELTKNGHFTEILCENLENEVAADAIDDFLNEYLGDDIENTTNKGQTPESDEDIIKACLIESFPKYSKFLEGMLEKNLAASSTAKDMHVTRQRISQLLNKDLAGLLATKRKNL